MRKTMIKVVSIVGARPQFIKAALVSEALRRTRGIREIFVHTGQHYDFKMSEIFFQELALKKPDYYLGVGSGSHAVQTGKMMMALEPLLMKEHPDLVIVYGDTNSTLAAVIAASKLHLRIAHVEAGPRAHDFAIPEEVNRVVTDRLCDILLCPTKHSWENLEKEDLRARSFLTGDVMRDLLVKNKRRIDASRIVRTLGLAPKKYILMTLHRPDNVDEITKIKSILRAINALPYKVVFPVHPRTAATLKRGVVPERYYANILFTEPFGYVDFLKLQREAFFIITDSGGVQKEAYLFKTPCLTLRRKTEWVETVRTGWNTLCPPDARRILTSIKHFKTPSSHPPFFGSGNAAEKMVHIMKRKVAS